MPEAADFAWTLTGARIAAASGSSATSDMGVRQTSDDQPVALEERRQVDAVTTGSESDATETPGSGSPMPTLGTLLGLAFLGGLLLHLTPTVLPVSLLSLAALARDDSDRTTPASVAAFAAVAGVALGAMALGVWSAGDPTATWGRQLQAPLPVAALTVLATLLALHLWGLLRLPLLTSRERGDSAAGTTATGITATEPTASAFRAPSVATALLTGLVIVALGLAWDLPPLSRSLGPALAGAGGTGVAVAGLVGWTAGLALPFLAIAFVPALRHRLAVAGGPAGSKRLAEAGGFLLAGSVLWLLYLLSRQVSGEGVAYVQLTLLAVAMVAWLRHTARRPVVAALLATVLLLLLVAVLWLANDQALTTAYALEPAAVEFNEVLAASRS